MADQAQGISSGAERVTRQEAGEVRSGEDEVREVEREEEHPGGGRFNRLLLIVIVAIAMIVGVVTAQGIRSAGVPAQSANAQPADDGADAARNKAKVEELAAASAPRALVAAVALPPVATLPTAQAQVEQRAPRPPSRYGQWAEDKYMRALEAPQMVTAFHGGTLEIGSAKEAPGAPSISSSDPNVTLHPPASPYTVMAGSVIPAVMVSGINSDLPGPILAQVSQNVFDSATGKSLLIPQGSRLIGAYRNASAWGQQRVQIAWQRLIFPNTASMDLPQMPGTDQGGYAGFADRVNNHYLATFGAAAVMSLISAGQMVGQMATFGGGGTYGGDGYQPNQWAMAGEMAGSGASGQFGGVGQQMAAQGMNRPPTIEIRPGYQFDVMVTEDLVFPGPFKQ
jgi:type IV secretory pathway VirB10-like protein